MDIEDDCCEAKYHYTSLIGNCGGGGSTWHNDTFTQTIVGMAEGTPDGQRIGKRICVDEIDIRLSMFWSSTYGQDYGYQLFRMVIWLDKQCNGTAPLASDIMRSPAGPTTPGASSPYQRYNEDRFIILKDKTYTFNATASTYVAYLGPNPTLASIIKKAHIVIKDLDIPVIYKGTGNTVSDVSSNNIGILYLFDNYHRDVGLYGQAEVKYYN